MGVYSVSVGTGSRISMPDAHEGYALMHSVSIRWEPFNVSSRQVAQPWRTNDNGPFGGQSFEAEDCKL